MNGQVRQLVVTAGPDKGRVFLVTDAEPLQIGRGTTTNTKLTDIRVSRHHCTVEAEGGRVVVKDLQSTVGTFVNDQRITEQALAAGDIIRIGDTELKFEAQELADAPTMAGATLAAILNDVIPSVPRGGTREPLDELIGTTLAQYEVGPVIARGRTSVLFKARDIKDDKTVALKVLLPAFSRSDSEMQRLVRSIQPVLPLRHPNLVSLYGLDKTGAHCWIAMEFVEGETLTQVIERVGLAGMLDWQHALRVAVHLARALVYLAEQRVLHRNITPRNILISGRDKSTKLSALMRAKVQDRGVVDLVPRPDELIRDGAYVAPERVHDEAQGDARSDIYSLGATIYALLSGRPPFEGKSAVELIAKILQAEPVNPKEFQLSLPDRFAQSIRRMMAKKPEDRYQSAAELLADLERIAANPQESLNNGRPPAAPPAPIAAATKAPEPALLDPEGVISVICRCGRRLQAREKFAGTRVRCPACGTFLMLPGRSAVDIPAPSRVVNPVSSKSPSANVSEAGPRRTSLSFAIVVLLAGAVVVGALLYAGGFLKQKGSNPAPDESPFKSPAAPNRDRPPEDARPRDTSGAYKNDAGSLKKE